MIKEQATVTGIDGNWAVIQMQRASVCSHCELNSGCGMGAIGRLLGHRSKPVMIVNEHQLKAGDRVILGLPERAFLKASLLIYGFPLLGLMVSGLLARWVIGEAEIFVITFALAGFVAGLRISAKIARNQYSNQFSPRVLEVRGEPTG